MLNIQHPDGRDVFVRLSSVHVFFGWDIKTIERPALNIVIYLMGYLAPINWKKSENALAVFNSLIKISFDMTEMYNQFTVLSLFLCVTPLGCWGSTAWLRSSLSWLCVCSSPWNTVSHSLLNLSIHLILSIQSWECTCQSKVLVDSVTTFSYLRMLCQNGISAIFIHDGRNQCNIH